MRKPSLVVVLVIVAVLIGIGVSLRGEGGGRVTRWLASLHGGGGH
jgi:hypothetical protein